MKISILTLFPKMINGFFAESIVRRAVEKKAVEIEIVDLRKFAIDDYGTVDDRPYGGGAGMILRVDVLSSAIKKSKVESLGSKVILTSPKGKLFNQSKAQEYSKLEHLVIIAGHYEGVDERVMEYVDEEISLGNFILSGGELVASCITEAVVRLIPGVLKKKEATEIESFFMVSINRLIETIGEVEILLNLKKKGIKNVPLLEFPQYTRPEVFDGKKVPEILREGDHKKIEAWKIKKAYEETLKKRPDLLTGE